MWLKGKLSLSKFESANCVMLPIMPFMSNGSKQLTPSNAVDLLYQKLLPNDVVFAFMTTANREADFIEQLTLLAGCISMPDFQKALRISKTLMTLGESQMIIPAIDDSVVKAPMMTPQIRQIQSAKKSGKIKSVSMSKARQTLSSFTVKQAQVMNNLQSSAQDASSKRIDVFYFFGLASSLKNDIPNDHHLFTLLTGFTGDDVSKLIDLIEVEI